ncbi:MAG: hypothetical protein ACI9UA_004872 [Pseudoalteromonas tetraodonis]|jgi:hypothetical protein
MEDLFSIPAQFDLRGGELDNLSRIGIGHINDTYLGSVRERGGQITRYVFQRINRSVFPDIVSLMENIRRVTEHLEPAYVSTGRQALRLIPTLDGADYHRDPAGDFWRAFPLIENSVTHSVLSSPAQAQQTGFAFGEFSQILSTLPEPPLHEVIADFHNTAKRYKAFLAAVDADLANRVDTARAEIDAALDGAAWATIITDAQLAGDVPSRVAHNDSKIENVLFDAETGEPVCVVDLDTTMPGSILHDFGDLVRTAAAIAPEDETDSGRIGVSLTVFQSLSEGFLSACGEILTPVELALLASAGKVIVYEQALRFLTDHLLGDTYYRIKHEGHNLERARNQLKVAQILDSMQSSLETSISTIYSARF